MSCDRWTCPKCGRAKVHRLARLVAAADPERFVTLSRAGEDLRNVYRASQTLSQALRRRGYTWEYLQVPERHQNGSWHLHVIQRGDFIPQKVLSERAESAGMGSVVDIRRIREPDQAAKYLVKYLTKSAGDPELRNANRYRASRGFFPGGRREFEREVLGVSAGASGWSVVGSAGELVGRCS